MHIYKRTRGTNLTMSFLKLYEQHLTGEMHHKGISISESYPTW